MRTQLRLTQSTQAVILALSLNFRMTEYKRFAFYLSNLFCEQGTNKDNQHDLTVGRNFVLTNKNNEAEEGQEHHVSKLQ